MSVLGRPFDDIRALLARMPAGDETAADAVRGRDAQLTKPAGSLGQLEAIAAHMARWQGKAKPKAETIFAVVFAGNHGVVAQGVSPFPASVTQAMVANFRAGGAAINQLCATFGIGLKVFELALELPTADITQAPAMDEKTCAATFAYGMEAVAGRARDWAGRGTGVDDAGLARKVAAIEAAVALHAAHLGDPLEVMRRLGGREIAAMAGAILAARIERVPVILDGYVCCAAAAILHALDVRALDHCLAGHCSAEGAHADVLRRLGLRPLLDLGMRLGEASGAALAAGVVKAAVATHNGMATFAEAGVAGRSQESA